MVVRLVEGDPVVVVFSEAYDVCMTMTLGRSNKYDNTN
jgi:hypothetical protein